MKTFLTVDILFMFDYHKVHTKQWGISSSGRASGLQPEGERIVAAILHHFKGCIMEREIELLREIATNLAMFDPFGGEHDDLLADEAIEMAKKWYKEYSLTSKQA